MPAKSIAQQRAMGIALAAQRGLIPRSHLKGPARKMMNMTEQQLSDFAKGPQAGKPMHVKKKWWGGPLAGFAPQSQARAAMQGLGQLQMPNVPPQTAVTQAPMMPSLSALMAPPARGFQGPLGSFAEGGIPGAGSTKVPPDTMLLKSQMGFSRLPDEFYYLPGMNPKNKPQDFAPASPREKKEMDKDPEKFGRPVAGLLHSEVPGRIDQLPVSVASGSYVVPADIISGLGQGNTTAGAKMLLELLQKVAINDNGPATGSPEPYMPKSPYGLKVIRDPEGNVNTIMNQRVNPLSKSYMDGSNNDNIGTRKLAAGGSAKAPIPIVAAGGEYVVPPRTVAALGGGDEAKGHAILDKFVLSVRKSVAERLRKLPPPRRD